LETQELSLVPLFCHALFVFSNVFHVLPVYSARLGVLGSLRQAERLCL
jgi:hypothetical protein